MLVVLSEELSDRQLLYEQQAAPLSWKLCYLWTSYSHCEVMPEAWENHYCHGYSVLQTAGTAL